MEIKLSDNSKLVLTHLADNRLKIELYQPRTLRDGHGYTFSGQAVLESETLNSLLAGLNQHQDREAA